MKATRALPGFDALLRRVRRAADRLDSAGLVGIAVLATCVGYYLGTIRPLQDQVESLQADFSTTSAPETRAAEDDPQARLLAFVERFPAERDVARLLAHVYALGEREGVRLAHGEYRFVEADALGMVQYRVTLPVSGSYPRIRGFVTTVLAQLPSASINQVSLQRERIGQPHVDARVELTLHLRAGGIGYASAPAAPERVSAVQELVQ